MESQEKGWKAEDREGQKLLYRFEARLDFNVVGLVAEGLQMGPSSSVLQLGPSEDREHGPIHRQRLVEVG